MMKKTMALFFGVGVVLSACAAPGGLAAGRQADVLNEEFSRAVVSGAERADRKEAEVRKRQLGEEKSEAAGAPPVETAPSPASKEAVSKEEPKKGPGITIVLNRAPLGQALTLINQAAGVSYQIGAGVDLSRDVSGAYRDLPARDVFESIASQLDYDIEEPVRGTYRIVAVVEKKFFLPVISVVRDYKSSIGGETLGATSSSGATTGQAGVTGQGTAGSSDQTRLTAEVELGITHKADVWKIIEKNVKALLTKTGSFLVDAEHSYVSVRDAVPNVRLVKGYLDNVKEVWLRQVEFDVAVIEVNNVRDTDYGLDWNKIFQTMRFGGALIAVGASPTGQVAKSPQAAKFSFASGRDTALIRALEEQGKVKVLNRPKVRTLSHQPVTLTSAVLEPFVSSLSQTVQSQGTATGSATISRAASGLVLGLIPVVDGEDVLLTIQPIINDITDYREFTLYNTVIEHPTINSRGLSTVARVRNGETIVLADYRRERDHETVRGFPFISRIPIIGALLGGYEASKGRRHMVITLTTRIVGAGDSLMASKAEEAK